ncbi:MAG: PD-(D/E)XK nuclease family protein [bacterium]
MSTLNDYRARPHWSFSALNQFVNICSLQYAFQRVMKLQPSFTQPSLSFGTTFHRVCEWLNLTRRDGTMPLKTEASDLFGTLWERQIREDKRIKFDDQKPDELCRQGQQMIGCLVENIDRDERVLTVNEAFAVPLVDASGESLEVPLIGEIDTVIEKDGHKTLVDWKTSGSRWPKQKASMDMQPTAFLYGYQHTHGEIPSFRFDVIVKNKTPVMEQHLTTRTQDQFNRMVHLVRQVDRMIQAEAWLPSEQSFYCNGCGYQEACRGWHRQQARTVSLAA